MKLDSFLKSFGATPRHPEAQDALLDYAHVSIRHGLFSIPNLDLALPVAIMNAETSPPCKRLGIPVKFFRHNPPILREGQVVYGIQRQGPVSFELIGEDERLLGCVGVHVNPYDTPLLGLIDPRVDLGVVIQWFDATGYTFSLIASKTPKRKILVDALLSRDSISAAFRVQNRPAKQTV